MSANQLFLLQDNSSAANYKAWASAIGAQLTAFGWSKTSDTGQVDWSTNPAVPASGSYLYEIWKPGDALQTGASQFFVKLEYGHSGYTPPCKIRVSIGTGTNGSGTLTGFVLGPYDSPGSSPGAGGGSTTVYESDFSGDTDRFSMLIWRNSGGAYILISIERTKDSTGANTADGVTIWVCGYGTTVQRSLMFGKGLGNSSTKVLHALANQTAGTDVAFNEVPAAPAIPDVGHLDNPATTIAVFCTNDIADGVIITASLYGASRSYIAQKSGIPLNNWITSNFGFLMRFD